ncbi:MAG: hypothetical protein WCG44_04080 [bacterium]
MLSIEYLRSFKILGFAIFDLTVSFIGIYLLAPVLSRIFALAKIDIPRINWLFLTLPLSIIVHIAVGNFTPMTRDFLDLSSHYFLKIFIIALLYLGLRGIKLIK